VALYLHPQYIFMVWCLVKHRDNFTFTLIFIREEPRLRVFDNRVLRRISDGSGGRVEKTA
jgi:hypothetical protein